MDAKTRRPFSCSLGLSLGEVHWNLSADAQEAPGDLPSASAEPSWPIPRPERSSPLPLTDLDLHVTGGRGSFPDALRGLVALLRRILASGRERPTPVERDYVAGYLRQLLLEPSSPFFLDPL